MQPSVRRVALRRVPGRRPLSNDAAAAASAGTAGPAGPSTSTSSSTAFNAAASLQGKPRAELAPLHPLLRTAQVAEALRQGFQDGRLPARCTATASTSTTAGGASDVEAALRAARARPSLLVPLAGSVGFGLRCLTQLLPGTAPVAQGVLGSIEAALDDGVRAAIQLEGSSAPPQPRQQQEQAKAEAAAATAVKELLKARRDGLAASTTGASESSGGSRQEPLAQGTQLLCQALLLGAERV